MAEPAGALGDSVVLAILQAKTCSPFSTSVLFAVGASMRSSLRTKCLAAKWVGKAKALFEERGSGAFGDEISREDDGSGVVLSHDVRSWALSGLESELRARPTAPSSLC